MRRIIYDVAVSLDGYIAGEGGDISAFPPEGEHLSPYLERLQSYETVIMGRKTYEFGYRWGLEPGRRAYAHMDHYIFSHSLSLPEPSDVTLVRDNWLDQLITLRQGRGGDIYLCGGGMFAGFVADCGLLDCIVLKIAPVIIGTGVPLFAGLERARRFYRRNVTLYNNGVTLVELEPMG